ncbi:unnamed protein product [Arabidopsis lyrata]|uniref:uncharacterized protein LOC9305327 n=1 Tax=Arabidopsis lyrata subsp. lyrata TaxID=81972 RepID=UPI000A29E618|nr:uncharacterized protein LOC9305327 [Arabidopsis lyrata subsp. lyrata]CAH8274569.1 unnamed protein product [Arabidopsis lyrata]|eukprot:XP_020875632.1 uncharacterized protein LOC9305327 [Arabidopsis lyrata subsp. lyrata]
MSSNSREARRRKILERGSDRLAFITGQINGAHPPPPSDSTSSLSQSHLQSSPDPIPPRDQILKAQEIAFTSHQENISDAEMLDNVDRIIHQSRAESLQPQRHAETLAEASGSDPRDATIQASPTTSSVQNPSVVNLGASQAFIPVVSFVNAITPKHIGAAIDASEYARMFTALAIALVVILSHLGFSSLGNIVSFRPVFLLLLTDATIVLGRVLLSHHGDSSSASGTVMSEQGMMDQVGNALEMVMMMKKIMDALLMDFSLYAVILICGLLVTQSIFP